MLPFSLAVNGNLLTRKFGKICKKKTQIKVLNIYQINKK